MRSGNPLRLGALLLGTAALLIACGAPEPAANTAAENPAAKSGPNTYSEVYINPYRNECDVDGELRLCYVASIGDTGNFSPYTGTIENFDYEWGYAYTLSGSGDAEVFTVEEVAARTAEPGGVHFPLALTGGGDRIVQTGDGVYQFYDEKTFICGPEASCETLDRVIGREQVINFEFETPDDPADPLLLLSWDSETLPAQVGEQPPLLLGKTWKLDFFTVSKDAVQPLISGSEVTAEFTLDNSFSTGTVSGYGGCNDYTANIMVSGNEMQVTDMQRGEAQCTNPPGVMQQEQEFTSALSVVQSFLVDGDKLELYYNNEDSILNMMAGAASE